MSDAKTVRARLKRLGELVNDPDVVSFLADELDRANEKARQTDEIIVNLLDRVNLLETETNLADETDRLRSEPEVTPAMIEAVVKVILGRSGMWSTEEFAERLIRAMKAAE